MAEPNDPVTWTPAINSAGTGPTLNDRYDIPGSTRIDQTIDSGQPVRIDRGSTTTDVNQIITQIRSRITAINSALGTTRPLPALIPVAITRIDLQTYILNLRDDVDFIRSSESIFPPYSWIDPGFTTNTINTAIKGFHFAELRKALTGFGNKRVPTETFNSPGITRFSNTWPIVNNFFPSLNNFLTYGSDGSGGTSGSSTFNVGFPSGLGIERRATIFFRFVSSTPQHATTYTPMNPYTGIAIIDFTYNATRTGGSNTNTIYFGTTGSTSTPSGFSDHFFALENWGSISSSSSSGNISITLTGQTFIANQWYFLTVRKTSGAGFQDTFNQAFVASSTIFYE